MQVFRKQIALLSALALLSTGTAGNFPARFPSISASESVMEFARKLSAQKQSRNEAEGFAELRYSAQTGQLLQDGKAVSGTVHGFKVVNGALMCAVSQTETLSQKQSGTLTNAVEYLPLDEAAERIGCEIEQKNGDTIVRSPFQSARLIVRAKRTPALYGASSVTEGYRDLHVLQYETAADAYAAYQALSADSSVISVEPDRIYYADAAAETENEYIGPRNRWGVEAIGADPYRDWLKTQKETLPELRVAVIDSGVYAEHSWMQGRLAENGASFVEGSNGTADDNGHGSHCAGIIISSTLDNVKILPVKVLSSNGTGSTLDIYCGMMYALEQGVDAASMSLGGWGDSGLFNAAAEAFAEADIPLAVSAGNDAVDVKYKTPSMCPSAITVSAVGRSGDDQNKLELAYFSNFGKGVDFAAPGVDIESMGTYGEYATVSMDGTSMATPYVAACVADILSYDPTLTNDQIYTYLKANAVDLGEQGFDNSYGWGMVNLDHFVFTEQSVAAPIIEDTDTVLKGVPKRVKLTASDPNAEIYYTLDGSEPTPENGLLYDPQYGGVWIDRTETLQAIACVNGVSGKVASRRFRAYVEEPEINYPSGSQYEENGKTVHYLNGAQEVSFTGLDDAAYYYYTLDGSVPDQRFAAGIRPDGSISITENCVLTVRIQTVGGLMSDPMSFSFGVYAETPTFSVETDGTLAIRTYRKPDAIYYTLDGSEPVPGESLLYEAPLTLAETTHIRAISVSGKAVSYVVDYAYIVGGADIANALVIKDGVLVSYSGILTTLDLSAETFTAVGDRAFEGNRFLSTVTLPETCTKLGAYAFSDMQALMEVNGGHITEISEGTFKDSRFLLKLDAELTEIPAYAFCNSSMPLKNAKIQSIGDYGLFNNPVAVTNSDGIVWEGVESLGDYALAFSKTAGMVYDGKGIATGTLDLKSLKTLGKYAFSRNNNIAELILPETLTTAPEGMLMYAEGLHVLKAPGLTALDDYAFAFLPEDPSGIAVDFTKMTRLGKQSLSGFVMEQDVEFTALTELSEDVFSGGTFRTLSFPALRTIPANAFATEALIDALYFENVETVEKNAFVLEKPETEVTEYTYGNDDLYGYYGDLYSSWQLFYAVRYVVFGDKVKNFDPKAIAANAAIAITAVAAPKDSPVFRADIPTRTVQTPSVEIILESDAQTRANPSRKTVPQNTECVMRAIPLGFGVNLQWYTVPDAEYSAWLSGTPISGSNGTVLAADTSQPGSQRYCAAVVSEGAVGNASEIISIDVAEISDAGTAKTNETLILDFSGQKKIDGFRWLTCTFTPEQDGSYFLTRGFTSAGYLVYDPDWNCLSTVMNDSFDPEYALEGGKTYTIYVQSDMENIYDYIRIMPADVYGTLRSVSSAETDIMKTNVYTGKPVHPEGNVYWSNQYQYNSETGKYELKDRMKLTKDADYVLRYEEFPAEGFGRMYVFGIGAYNGLMVFSYDLVNSSDYYNGLPALTAGTPLKVTNLDDTAQQFVIQPAKSGYYTLSLNFTEASVQQYFERSDSMYMSMPDPSLSVSLVTKSDWSIVASDDDSNGIMLPMISRMYLEKGKTYVAEVSNEQGKWAVMDEAELLLETTPENLRLMTDTYTGEEFLYQSVFYTGEALEPELYLMDAAEETLLVRGTDYDAYYFRNTQPGYMNIYVTGKGRYRGCMSLNTEITYDHWNAMGDVGVITADETFTLQNHLDCFTFNLHEDGYYTLDMPENAAFSGVLQNMAGSVEWEYWNDMLRFTQDSFNCDSLDENGKAHHGRFFEAGTYYFAFEHTGETIPLTLKTEETVPDLSLAECAPASCNYTGEPIHPELHVTYGETLLKEGVDYEIVVPEDSVECGIQTLTLKGIGKFVGTLYVDVTVCPAKEAAHGVFINEGENKAEITKEHPAAYYLWKPTQENYILSSEQILRKNILIYEPAGDGTYCEYDRFTGAGYQCREIEVMPGKTYIVTASFQSPDMTGDLTFSLSGKTRFLYDCTLEGEEIVIVEKDGTAAKPEYRVLDGEKVLEPGKDYIEYTHEGGSEFGTAKLTLKGIGDYAGTLEYEYYIAPESPDDVFGSAARDATILTLDLQMNYVMQLPGYSYCSRFTAPKDGTYYLELPTSFMDGASAFVYDSKMNLLPMGTLKTSLKKGETLTIMSVTDFTEAFFQMSSSYSITVRSTIPDHYCSVDGFTFYVSNGAATLTSLQCWEDYGFEVPDSFIDPKYGTEVTFSGIYSNLYHWYFNEPVIYCKSGSKAAGFCRDQEYHYLLTDSKSTLKGDVSGDGLVDRHDAVILQRWLTELSGMKLPDFAYANADMNGDGLADILDVAAISEYIRENSVG